MSGGVHWFRIIEGEGFVRVLTYLNGANTPVDLTGFHANFYIDLAGETIMSLSDGAGITLGGTAGTIAITLPAATIEAAPEFSTAKYRLLLTPPGREPVCLLYGQFSKGGRT